MSPRNNDANDYLADFNYHVRKSIEAYRGYIRIRGDEIDLMEQFEAEFNQAGEKFIQFKSMALDHDKQAGEMLVLLNDELGRHQYQAEHLRTEIGKLKGKIEKQSIENEELELSLKENVERLQKLKYQNDNNGTYANASPIKSDPSSIFIQRLKMDPHC